MLLLKPNCECCDCDLPADTNNARICSFECTFCADCARDKFQGSCPNCGGNFVERPVRPAARLVSNPASTERFSKDHAQCMNFAMGEV